MRTHRRSIRSVPLTRQPASAQPHTVLLAVTGMSPAILTETIWALAHPADGAEPVIPHRVVALTTSEGRNRLEQLFQPSPQLGGAAPWDALRAALQKRGLNLSGRLRFGLTGDDIRVITAPGRGGRSRELDDLRSAADNEAAADFILHHLRAFAEDPSVRVVASIAGGRKTMGALLHASLTLVGRESDRLTHVLVSEPFETLPGFWFPAQPGPDLRDRQGNAHPAAKARLSLADVPFVPLRNLFARDLHRGPGGFLAMIQECRGRVSRLGAVEDCKLLVSRASPVVQINGATLRLAPTEFLLLLFLVERLDRGAPPIPDYKEAASEIGPFRNRLREDPGTPWAHGLGSQALDDQDLRRAVAGLRKKIQSQPGAAALGRALPERGRFSLNLAKGCWRLTS